MKTNRVVLAALITTVAQAAPPPPVEDIVTSGPHAGEKRIITNTVPFPPEATVLQKEALIALRVQGQQANVAAELMSYRHRFLRIRGTNYCVPFTCYEFQLRSKGEHGFVWSCWTPDFSTPHRFQVLTTESGKSYACYVREGVHLYRLSESRPADAMRRLFWEVPGAEYNPEPQLRHPDALPLLRMEQIGAALGPECLLHLNATTRYAEVLNLSDREGELRVTVRGREPEPGEYLPESLRGKWLLAEATFALRKGQWELVSTSRE